MTNLGGIEFTARWFINCLAGTGRLPLSAANWALVPAPCPGIERVLPAALACSTDQAAQVVRRLPAAAREWLRTAVLCLGRCRLPWHVAALILANAL